MFACLFLYKRILILNTKTCSLTSHNPVRDATKCLSENRVTMTARLTPDLSTNKTANWEGLKRFFWETVILSHSAREMTRSLS